MMPLRLIAPSDANDEDSIKRLARADRARGADALVRTFREPLFHHAAYILKDYEEAIDVVQEVFIKALREPRLFTGDFKIKAWLYRVTSNLCFNQVRDRRRRSAILDGLPRPSAADALQFEVVAQDERQQKILEAFDRVTEAHREILSLRYYSDLSYAEIADVLDIKLGTVMSRLSRARAALLETLDASDVDES
jgi:RNA polymerase sigma-70 factor (ECF subfamily)